MSPTDESERSVGEDLELRQRVKTSLRRKNLLRRPPHLRALVKLAENLPTRGNNLELFFEGVRLYDRMVEDIHAASERIVMEMYSFFSDRTGRMIARALGAAAQRGVEVRVIFDAVGSIGVPMTFFRVLEEYGVEVVEYHPIAPWRKRFALLERNHRKTMVIDGRIAYAGGMNIGDDWIPPPDGAGWRDSHARVEGPAAGDLEVLFTDSWLKQTDELLDLPRRVPRESPDVDDEEPGAQIYVIGRTAAIDRPMRRLYHLAIGQARRTITITSAYFVPDRALRRALRRAVERGVRVRLLLPAVSDVAPVLYASQRHFDRLLRRGVEIYRYEPSILHAKTAVIDGEWSTIGSANMDSLSFNWNLEANFVVEDRETGRELEDRFEVDLRHSERVDLAEWRRRPWWHRVIEWGASILGPVL